MDTDKRHSPRFRILFVCSGNICRSPMAAAIAAELLPQSGLEPCEIRSAGTLGIEGRPAAPAAQEVLSELDIDLSAHISQGLSPELLEWADAIVVMEPIHLREVLRLAEEKDEIEGRLYLLWQYTDREGRLDRIDDPIGEPLEGFLQCRNDLLECIRNFAKQLVEEARAVNRP